MRFALLAAVVSTAPVFAACGGRLLEESDADKLDGASDAVVDGPYTGEWCDPETGSTSGPGGDAIYCTSNPYTDAPEHCHRAYSATVQWNCCTLDDPLCCPLASHMEDHGYIATCCASDTDCTTCCDGIDPKP